MRAEIRVALSGVVAFLGHLPVRKNRTRAIVKRR